MRAQIAASFPAPSQHPTHPALPTAVQTVGLPDILETALSQLSTWPELPGGFSGHRLRLVLLHKGYWSHAMSSARDQAKLNHTLAPILQSSEDGPCPPAHKYNTNFHLLWHLSPQHGCHHEVCSKPLSSVQRLCCLFSTREEGKQAFVNTVCSERRQESIWC